MDEQVECMSDVCSWAGLMSECVHPKHDPDNLLCPECHERILFAETAQTSTERAAQRR